MSMSQLDIKTNEYARVLKRCLRSWRNRRNGTALMTLSWPDIPRRMRRPVLHAQAAVLDAAMQIAALEIPHVTGTSVVAHALSFDCYAEYDGRYVCSVTDGVDHLLPHVWTSSRASVNNARLAMWAAMERPCWWACDGLDDVRLSENARLVTLPRALLIPTVHSPDPRDEVNQESP